MATPPKELFPDIIEQLKHMDQCPDTPLKVQFGDMQTEKDIRSLTHLMQTDVHVTFRTTARVGARELEGRPEDLHLVRQRIAEAMNAQVQEMIDSLATTATVASDPTPEPTTHGDERRGRKIILDDESLT